MSENGILGFSWAFIGWAHVGLKWIRPTSLDGFGKRVYGFLGPFLDPGITSFPILENLVLQI